MAESEFDILSHNYEISKNYDNVNYEMKSRNYGILKRNYGKKLNYKSHNYEIKKIMAY